MEIVRDEPGPEKKLRSAPEPASTYVKWENPPILPRLQHVTAELQRHPNEWALIAVKSSPLMAWWRPLAAHPDFEIAYGWLDADRRLLVPRDVYARYVRRDLGGASAE